VLWLHAYMPHVYPRPYQLLSLCLGSDSVMQSSAFVEGDGEEQLSLQLGNLSLSWRTVTSPFSCARRAAPSPGAATTSSSSSASQGTTPSLAAPAQVPAAPAPPGLQRTNWVVAWPAEAQRSANLAAFLTDLQGSRTLGQLPTDLRFYVVTRHPHGMPYLGLWAGLHPQTFCALVRSAGATQLPGSGIKLYRVDSLAAAQTKWHQSTGPQAVEMPVRVVM
jgi:hypothetical protein